MFNLNKIIDRVFATSLYAIVLFFPFALSFVVAQPFPGGVQQYGLINVGNCASWQGIGSIQDAGQPCLAGTASALTKTNDTNVTLTLGGTPNTSLLQPVSLTLGWTGILAPSRAGSSPANHATLNDVAGVSTWTVVPDCQDVSAQHLNYTQSSDLWSCGTGDGSAITALTGDVTATGPGSVAATLASVITAGGPIGSATVTPVITYDAKGRLTTVSSATIAPPFSAITGAATLAQLPAMAANTVYSNWTSGSAQPLSNVWPACSNDGAHALTYTNGTGVLCTALSTGGTVTQIIAGTGLTGGTITTTGTIALSTPVTVANGGTGDTGTAWSTFTPTITCGVGSVGSYTTQVGHYKTLGKTVWISVNVQAAIGTCTGGVMVASLPVTSKTGINQVLSFLDATSGLSGYCYWQSNTTACGTGTAAGANPTGSDLIVASGVIESN